MDTLSTLTPEADRCCRYAWQKALDAGTLGNEFECPKCGCEYRLSVEGDIRLWAYMAWVARL